MQLSSHSGACYECVTSDSNTWGNQNHEPHRNRNVCFHTYNVILQCTILLLLYFPMTLPDFRICRKGIVGGLLQFRETCLFIRGFFFPSVCFTKCCVWDAWAQPFSLQQLCWVLSKPRSPGSEASLSEAVLQGLVLAPPVWVAEPESWQLHCLKGKKAFIPQQNAAAVLAPWGSDVPVPCASSRLLK